jgi:hypothetical protein
MDFKIMVLETNSGVASFEQVEVFWVVMQCSVLVGYQHFRGPCCLHLQGEVIGGGSVEL